MSKEEEKAEREAEGRGFKVSDRRRFVDHDGEAAAAERGNAGDDAAPEAKAQDDAPASKPAEPGSAVEQTSEPGASDAAGASGASDAPDPGSAGEQFPEMTFSTFVISLMTQALMHLGEVVPEGFPEGHEPARDLPAAKQMIDLLGILREKTTGNLDTNEEQLLGSMLYDLRMRYVEVSRGN